MHWHQKCYVVYWWIMPGKANVYEANPYGRTSPKYKSKQPPDKFVDEHKQGFVSKHNFTPLTPWTSVQPSLLTYFQVLRIWLFPLKATRQTDRRVKDRELGSSDRVKYELPSSLSPHSLLEQDVFTIRKVLMDLLYLRSYTATQHSYPASSLHPVCQQVWVHIINLEQESNREDSGREFVGSDKGGKVGQRTQTEAKTTAP